MTTVYKIMRKEKKGRTRLVSLFVESSAYKCVYTPGQKTCAPLGSLGCFAYDTLEAALADKTLRNKAMVLYECDALVCGAVEECAGILDEFVKKFYKGMPTIKIPAPDGTVVCAWVKPIKEIEKQKE